VNQERSVTHWIEEVKHGHEAAAQKLFEAYYRRLVGLARKKLGNMPRRAADEEDVAASAFNSFFEGLEKGKFPQLSDRNGLWRLLVRITACKAIDVINREAHRVQYVLNVDEVIGREPSPAFALQVADEYERLLQKLDDAKLRSIAVWKLEGLLDREIAGKLNCTIRTVERKLERIRNMWSKKMDKRYKG
jgi:DNA-directed RNA polymerase specialized sigma24 family protein